MRIRVTDITHAVAPNAEVALLGFDDKPVRTQRTDAHGESAWTELPIGDNRFRISLSGFSHRFVTATVHNEIEIQIDTMLELGTIGGLVTLEPPFPDLLSPEKHGRVRIRVADKDGVVMPNVTVIIFWSINPPLTTSIQTGEKGEAVLADLPMGENHFLVSTSGFADYPLAVTLRSSEEMKIDVKMQLAFVGEVVPVVKKQSRWWLLGHKRLL